MDDMIGSERAERAWWAIQIALVPLSIALLIAAPSLGLARVPVALGGIGVWHLVHAASSVSTGVFELRGARVARKDRALWFWFGTGPRRRYRRHLFGPGNRGRFNLRPNSSSQCSCGRFAGAQALRA